jgi:hypothetical protein
MVSRSAADALPGGRVGAAGGGLATMSLSPTGC